MFGPLDRVVRDEFGRIAPSDGMERYAKRSDPAPHSHWRDRTQTLDVAAAARPSINAWNTRPTRLRQFHIKPSSSPRWPEAMIREGRFHRGPGRGRFALEAFTRITQRANAPTGCMPRSMACVWAYIVSGAAQGPRTAAPTPPFGRTRILAILCRAGKVSPRWPPASTLVTNMTPDIAVTTTVVNRKSKQMTILFLRQGPLLPDGSVSTLPSFASDRFQFARNTQGDRDGNEFGETSSSER